MKGVISPLLKFVMFRWWKRKTQQPSKPFAWIRAGGIRGPFNPSEPPPSWVYGFKSHPDRFFETSDSLTDRIPGYEPGDGGSIPSLTTNSQDHVLPFLVRPLAQWSEQRAHNPLAVGSNPTGPTWFFCPHRLVVRTPGFHLGYRSSNLRGGANFTQPR